MSRSVSFDALVFFASSSFSHTDNDDKDAVVVDTDFLDKTWTMEIACLIDQRHCSCETLRVIVGI